MPSFRVSLLPPDHQLVSASRCGVAFAHSAPDYNGHWGVQELCDICPMAQQKRCADDHQQPTDTDITRVLDRLGYETHFVIEEGHVWTHGLGEQKRYALQHTLRYQMWELDQPHYLHAHGRSLRGHVASPEVIEHVDKVREEFINAARYEDD